MLNTCACIFVQIVVVRGASVCAIYAYVHSARVCAKLTQSVSGACGRVVVVLCAHAKCDKLRTLEELYCTFIVFALHNKQYH